MNKTSNCQAMTKNGSKCKNKTRELFCGIHKNQLTNSMISANSILNGSYQMYSSNIVECAICYENCDISLKCNHYVHLECIKNGMKPECPLCRTDISELFNESELNLMEQRLDDVTDSVNESLFYNDLDEPITDIHLSFEYFLCDNCFNDASPSIIRLF